MICEQCWLRAQQDAFLLGGSVVDHYRRRVREATERNEIHDNADPETVAPVVVD